MKKKAIYQFATAENDTVNTLRTITLFGNNVSTYKFALLHVLLQQAPKSEVGYADIKEPFVQELYQHYCTNPSQFTAGPNSLTQAFDNYRASDRGTQDWMIVLKAAEALIYNNVFDAFHNVGGGTIDIPYRLFEHNRKTKKLIFTDNLNQVLQNDYQRQLLNEEGQGRWRVVEEAWKAGLSPNLLEYNDTDGNLYSISDKGRVHLRSAVSVLLPYQHGRCFYCNRKVNSGAHKESEDFPDVDHFMPLSFLIGFNILPVNPNGVWNLVIACRNCNRGPSGKFATPAHERYFKALHDRNLLFAEEHRHSLKNSILLSLAAANSIQVSERMLSLYSKFKYIKGWVPPFIYP